MKKQMIDVSDIKNTDENAEINISNIKDTDEKAGINISTGNIWVHLQGISYAKLDQHASSHAKNV
jgi:hypothetical protein